MPTEHAPLLKQLRNNVEFASVSQFLHTFQSALDPPRSTQRSSSQNGSRQATPLMDEGPFDTEHFETMLLDDGERYRLEYLIIRLLKVLTRNRLVSAETWQLYLIREFYKREPEDNNPFYQANYWPFPMSKTKIIYEPVEPAPKDDDDNSSVLSEEEKRDDDDEDSDRDKRQDSKASEVKDEENVKLEEQTPEIEGPMQEEQPDAINFFDLSLDTRVHVLHVLCEWQLDEPERMREHLASEDDAAHWRVDPVGYDAQGNTYWLFDDNRLYRESQAPPKKSKAKGKGKRGATKKKAPPPPPVRRGTRRGLRSAPEDPPEEEQAPEQQEPVEEEEEEWMPWKMLCLTTSDWQNFPKRFENSKHRDEQRFHQYLTRDLIPQIVPILEEREKEKKLEEALSHRKRSSRIQIRDLQQQERLRQEALEYAHRQQRRMTTRQEDMAKKKEDEEQAQAVNTREERLKERELRIQQREMEKVKALSRQEERAAREQERIQKEQEKAEAKAKAKAAKAAEAAANPDQPAKPAKKRGPKGPRKKKVTEEEDNWVFDCLCGVKGQNLDDGTPMIACGRCSTWAHIACLAKHDPTRKSMKAWENVDYTCRDCIARAQQRQQQQPPSFQAHYTIDHEKERIAENPHKRPWLDSPPQANPPFKYSRQEFNSRPEINRRPEVNSYGPPQPAPPRMPVFSHQGYSSDGTAQRPRIDSGPRYPPAPYGYPNGGGQNGQHTYHPSGPSLPAPPPPVSQAPIGPPHGYSLPHISAASTSSFSSSQLPPLQAHPPASTNNQWPHLNPILPPANKLPFSSSSANALPRPQAPNSLPSMSAAAPPTLPPMQQLPPVQQQQQQQQHNPSLPYPPPSTTSYPYQSQLPSLGPVPQQQSGQSQQR